MSARPTALMLVSARVDARLRDSVAAGLRPEPEYLRLERDYGVEILDWTALGPGAQRRSPRLAIRHAMHASRRLDEFESLLSDGEHVGVPLAFWIRSRRASVRHGMIGHHLTTAKKRLLLGAARPALRHTHFILHCGEQMDYASQTLRVPSDHTHLVPYGIDLTFWRPTQTDQGGFVMAAGKDHRDYVTLVEACTDAVDNVFVAGSSLHSASATSRVPTRWPAGFETGLLDFATLRERYAASALFVLPLLPTDFQAGVTALLEAMAMGKAIVATANPSVAEVIVDGETGVLVPPEDPAAMRAAILELMSDPSERRRLGRNARDAAERRHGLYDYAARLYAVTEGAVGTPVC